MSDTEITKVIFRRDRKKGGEVTAVFPEDPSSCQSWYYMSCYSHVGQHGSCLYDWYRTTRLAIEEEYASLKYELESPPYEYKLQVVQKITPSMRQKRMLTWESWMKQPVEP